LRRKERKNRDEFRKLMDEHKAAGFLTAKTMWRDYLMKVLYLCLGQIGTLVPFLVVVYVLDSLNMVTFILCHWLPLSLLRRSLRDAGDICKCYCVGGRFRK
jgi:hypothetical protein